eukprot:14252437-Alexandrium_andersonii.AAC.1
MSVAMSSPDMILFIMTRKRSDKGTIPVLDGGPSPPSGSSGSSAPAACLPPGRDAGPGGPEAGGCDVDVDAVAGG